ncbi:hypothetical protein GUJ93_ZPchr0001g30389 [Zizania palustris]|uniref:Uncharacterized protein n=1 Tax=Zizania palustris TaxID=103762 RepID=A0A8J5R702_ZIZPA|nr:hypothetical protein GUJ93_ZPchr0001g30389 [Zizania palustris]
MKRLDSSWPAPSIRASRLHALLRQRLVRPKISARHRLNQKKTEDLADGFVEKKKTDQNFGSQQQKRMLAMVLNALWMAAAVVLEDEWKEEERQ